MRLGSVTVGILHLNSNRYITNPSIDTLPEYDIYAAENSVRSKNGRVLLPKLNETFEDPMTTYYCPSNLNRRLSPLSLVY